MITIQRLEEFCIAAVAACEHIASYELVFSESELKDVIEDVKKFPLLVAVLPGANGDDVSYDNVAERNEGLFFVLKPTLERMSRKERVELWAETQEGMRELKEFIHANVIGDFRDIFFDDSLKERSIEPEFNVADCNGWSLLFYYSTSGF